MNLRHYTSSLSFIVNLSSHIYTEFRLTRSEAFEGLGLGTRLAFLQLPPKWNWVPTAAALVYSAMTPLGMAIGLGAQGGLVS
jgi:hypothetical protein